LRGSAAGSFSPRSSGGNAAAKPAEQLRRWIGIRRQAEFELRLLHARPRRQAELAVDLADVMSLPQQLALQFGNLARGQCGRLAVAGRHARRAGDSRGQVGGGGGVDQRLIPLQEGMEVLVGEEGRPEPAHGQEQRGLQIVGRKRPAVGQRDTPLRPLRARMLDREIRLLPGQAGGHAHLLQPGLAPPPAVLGEQVRRRGEHVRDAMDEVAPTVAVEVDGVFEIRGRRELRLADFAGPGADHLGRRKVAALDHPQGVEQLLAEHLGTSTVVGERHQRAQHRQIAVVGAEVGLQSPEGDDDRRRHAELLLDAREQRGVAFDPARTGLQPMAVRHAAGELQEALLENFLSAVLVDDALVERRIGKRVFEGGAANALR